MSSAKRQSAKAARHVRLYHWLMKTDAWNDLDCVARVAYLEIAARYGGVGSNNGRIPCSVREIAESIGVGKSTAHRALGSLQDHGFIVLERAGAFNMKQRHATEWRLTEFKSDLTGELATKDFTRWKKTKHGSVSGTDKYPQRDALVPHMGQSPVVTVPYGSVSGTDGRNGSPTSGTLLVYQGNCSEEQRLHAANQKASAPAANEFAPVGDFIPNSLKAGGQ